MYFSFNSIHHSSEWLFRSFPIYTIFSITLHSIHSLPLSSLRQIESMDRISLHRSLNEPKTNVWYDYFLHLPRNITDSIAQFLPPEIIHVPHILQCFSAKLFNRTINIPNPKPSSLIYSSTSISSLNIIPAFVTKPKGLHSLLNQRASRHFFFLRHHLLTLIKITTQNLA